MKEPSRRLIVGELRSRDGDTAVIAISDGRGGEELLTLPPPYSAPQFLPDIGEDVPLDMQGPVPQVVARQIAVDAIGAREARFDLMTTLLFYGAKIVAGDPDAGHIELDSDSLRLYRPDGVVTIRLDTATGNALVTGEYRSAESGERFVINAGGVNPGEIRFYPATGAAYGSIRSGTANTGLPNLTIEGAVGPEGSHGELIIDGELATLAHKIAGTTTAASTAVGLNAADLIVEGYGKVGVRPNSVFVLHVNNAFQVMNYAFVKRFETDATGVGFNGAVPIARRTLNAAATTNVEALALVNQLRTLLIDVGLAQ